MFYLQQKILNFQKLAQKQINEKTKKWHEWYENLPQERKDKMKQDQQAYYILKKEFDEKFYPTKVEKRKKQLQENNKNYRQNLMNNQPEKYEAHKKEQNARTHQKLERAKANPDELNSKLFHLGRYIAGFKKDCKKLTSRIVVDNDAEKISQQMRIIKDQIKISNSASEIRKLEERLRFLQEKLDQENQKNIFPRIKTDFTQIEVDCNRALDLLKMARDYVKNPEKARLIKILQVSDILGPELVNKYPKSLSRKMYDWLINPLKLELDNTLKFEG